MHAHMCECVYVCVSVCSSAVQQAPVLVAANHELKKKYLGRMTEEPLMAVSEHTPPHTAECPLCTHIFMHCNAMPPEVYMF